MEPSDFKISISVERYDEKTTEKLHMIWSRAGLILDKYSVKIEFLKLMHGSVKLDQSFIPSRLTVGQISGVCIFFYFIFHKIIFWRESFKQGNLSKHFFYAGVFFVKLFFKGNLLNMIVLLSPPHFFSSNFMHCLKKWNCIAIIIRNWYIFFHMYYNN